MRLKKINKDLPVREVLEFYLPLSRLLNFCYISNFRKQAVLEQFFGINGQHAPYIISITGSVAVGKSTTARVLQILLSHWLKNYRIELVTTDDFLHPNQILEKRNLMKKKGFPQSYDIYRLLKFISDLKSGFEGVSSPVYSHLMCDIVPGKNKIFSQPDILILEGLNVLQNGGVNCCHSSRYIFISEFVDFSIYIDAPENLIKNWYIDRFLKFREKAFSNPKSYFCKYANLTEEEAIDVATLLWNDINYINLKENILPTRERADLVLTKSENHTIGQICLRK